MTEWKKITSKRAAKKPSLWETLDKNVWSNIISFVVGPIESYRGHWSATFTPGKLEKPLETKVKKLAASDDDNDALTAIMVGFTMAKDRKAWNTYEADWGRYTKYLLVALCMHKIETTCGLL